MTITGADIRPGHVLLSGHMETGEPLYVDSVAPYPNSPGPNWVVVRGTWRGEITEMPYRLDEIVDSGTDDDTGGAASFRDMVRAIVHAGPNDSDADVLALLEKDHTHRADDLGCIGCD